MGLVGDFATLGVILCAVLVFMLLPAFFLSIPGWLIGRISAPNAPRLKKVRRTSAYWTAWVLLGGAPLTVSVIGGPFAGSNQVIPTVWAVLIAFGGFVALNVNAFMLGYKSGLAAKAKRDIRKNFEANFAPSAHPEDNVDWLDPNHPAIASQPGDEPTATKPLPAVDANRRLDEDAPTQEIVAHGTAPLNDEYPTARPHGY